MAGRRQFFRHFAVEALAFIDECRGRPQLRLDELDQLPRPALESIIPVVREDLEVIREGHMMVARSRRTDDPATPLFPIASDDGEVLDLFDGRRTLGEVAASLESPADLEARWERCRDLFLRLARMCVCVPANAPSEAEG